jgi:deoxycytidine triphosphate deaminase
MVWIRTRDKVKIPNDMVGFWWQTNTLSRQGLMLVNMSMVEPGYEETLLAFCEFWQHKGDHPSSYDGGKNGLC